MPSLTSVMGGVGTVVLRFLLSSRPSGRKTCLPSMKLGINTSRNDSQDSFWSGRTTYASFDANKTPPLPLPSHSLPPIPSLTHTSVLWTGVCVCVCVHVCVHVCVRERERERERERKGGDGWMYICVCAHVSVRIYVCVCVGGVWCDVYAGTRCVCVCVYMCGCLSTETFTT